MDPRIPRIIAALQRRAYDLGGIAFADFIPRLDTTLAAVLEEVAPVSAPCRRRVPTPPPSSPAQDRMTPVPVSMTARTLLHIAVSGRLNPVAAVRQLQQAGLLAADGTVTPEGREAVASDGAEGLAGLAVAQRAVPIR